MPRTVLVAVTAAALAATTVFAAEAMTKGPLARADAQAKFAVIFDRVDADHDGYVTRAEADAARATMMARHHAKMAAKSDDKADDHAAMHGPGAGPMHGMAMGGRMFDMIDADHDGRVSRAEASTHAMAAFDRFDTNHDGKLDADEREAAHATMKAMKPAL